MKRLFALAGPAVVAMGLAVASASFAAPRVLADATRAQGVGEPSRRTGADALQADADAA